MHKSPWLSASSNRCLLHFFLSFCHLFIKSHHLILPSPPLTTSFYQILSTYTIITSPYHHYLTIPSSSHHTIIVSPYHHHLTIPSSSHHTIITSPYHHHLTIPFSPLAGRGKGAETHSLSQVQFGRLVLLPVAEAAKFRVFFDGPPRA